MKFCKLSIFIFLFTVLLGAAGCVDEAIYNPVEIGDGVADISATVKFESFVPALTSRTSGTAIHNINNMMVLVYDENENEEGSRLLRSQYFTTADMTNWTIDQNGNEYMPGDIPGNPDYYDPDKGNPHQAEAKTPQAKFDLKGILYGRYHIYVVANMGQMPADSIASPAILKRQLLTWNNADPAANNQMFGYFTPANNTSSQGFKAPLLTINQPTTNLHAWIKRAASKVTVSLDPSGLYENVYVYIKNITIRDVPRTCRLGESNKPESNDDLYIVGTGANANVSQEISFVKSGAGDSDNFENWARLAKGTNQLGSNHSESADAFFFYENMQGDYEGKGKDFCKVMQPEVQFGDTPIRTPDQKDFKDEIHYGTYIEVEGYYESRNSDRLTQGPIKYRFMLGKNTTFNYDAQRNHHYKLVLKLRGFANEADWHIDYVDEKPEVYVPTKFYVPYLYKKKSGEGLPVRLAGNAVSLKAEIIENNWAPYDSVTGTVPSSDHPGGNFYWCRNGYNFLNGKYNSETYFGNTNFVGFLSLREVQAAVVYEKGSPDDKNGYGPNTMKLLEDFYIEKKFFHVDNYSLEVGEHDIDNNSGNGSYIVKEDKGDGTKTVMVPLWTRAKSMGRMTGFTGNNPFASYQRKAVVRLTAKFRRENGDTVIVKEVPVFQVRRIENPKAIWRSRNRTDAFNVVLTHWASPTATEYTEFNSEGRWRVSVEKNGHDNSWVSITLPDGTGPDKDGYIYGSTDTPIKFTYKPTSTTTSDRAAIIKVEYHDYTCVHSIFVRQGYDEDVQLSETSNTLWSSHNVYGFVGSSDAGTSKQPYSPTEISCRVTKSPLSIGSLFKRGQYNYAVLESNNEDYKFNTNPSGSFLVGWYENASATGMKTESRKWDNFYGFAQKNSEGVNRLNWEWAGKITALNVDNRVYRVPSYQDFDALTSDSLNVNYGYGIVYGDGAKDINYSYADASAYTDYNNDGSESTKGVRACIVYNSNTGNQVIFPLGGAGYGRRQRDVGVLRYGSLSAVMSPGPNNINYYRPMIYNLWQDNGAIYWTNKVELKGHKEDDSDAHAWDINFFSFDFGPLDANALGAGGGGLTEGNSSDALPIKLVRTK